MDRAGISWEVAIKISGHKTDSAYRRYNIVDNRDIDDAGKKMEVFLDEGGAMEGTIGQGVKQEFTCPRCHETVPMLFTPVGQTDGWCQHCLFGVKREEVMA